MPNKCKLKKAWIEIEKEHTSSEKVARKIACDHYKEFGAKYYPALIKMEARLKNAKAHVRKV